MSPIPNKWEIKDVIATSLCPRRQIPPDIVFWSGLLTHYRNGVLWQAGGVADQPVIYLEVMQTLTTWTARLNDR